MGLRGLAGDMARNTSVLWRGLADAVDPDSRPRAGADHIDLTDSAISVAGDEGEHEGTMMVPLDTWTRILEQVGNVHEAGQQLADARERAARAETENLFLREQLTELKAQRRRARRATPKPATSSAATAGTPSTPSLQPTALDSRLVRARRRASIWLSP